MLARLNGLDGVRSAEVDHRGQLQRIRLDRSEVVSDAQQALHELGFATDDVTGDAPVGALRWYGADSVRELSREEAEVIARRVTPAVARDHGLDRAAAEQLRSAVAGALYGCFTRHTLAAGTPPGALRAVCSVAVEAAAQPLIGGDGARSLARTLWDDLEMRAQPEDRDG